MTNWGTAKLSTLCRRIGDGLHGTPSYVDNGNIYFINGNNLRSGKIIIDFDTKQVSQQELENNFVPLDENSLLLGINGTLGNMAFYNGENIMLGKSSAYLNFKSDINKFYYYYFQLPGVQKYFYDVATGSTIKNLSLKSLQDFEVPVPSKSEYRKIAAVLSALDDKIELNNQINAELEAMAKTLYDYWFVQFDFPNNDGKPYKSSGGKMVYNEVLKREIPKGWEVTVFNDWINKTKTGDWGKEEVEGNYTERVHCVRGADINGLNGKGDVKAPVRYILKNNLSKALQPNDFIVEISGGSPVQSTGRIAFLSNESFQRFDSHVICSNFCKAVSLKNESYAFNFKNEWQRLYDAGVFFGYEGKTSGIKNFLFDSFMNSYHIVKPPKELAQKYHQFATSLEKKKQYNLLQNQELAQLRDWLLPMLMNGQVTVGEVEKMGMVAEEHSTYKKMI